MRDEHDRINELIKEAAWSDRLVQVFLDVERAINDLKYTNALFKLSARHSPYYPLIRAMCRLKIIKDWPI